MSEFKDAVASSARIMAAVRAIESQRPDRLFEDSLAAQLAGEETIATVATSSQRI
jgi:O-methyltransferase involved in polyketide biosynthesis